MTTNDSSPLIIETSPQGVVTLTLNRPAVHNAFNAQLVQELSEALAHFHQNPPRILILTGQGHAFSAGADLAWMQSMVEASLAHNQADATRLGQMFRLLDTLPCPTIARVNGHAFGGGVGLMACSDVVIALETVQLGLTEVRLGLAPATIAPFVIPKIGVKHARRLMLTGERIAASTAQQMGLITHITPPHQLDGHVHDMVTLLLKGGPNAQRQTKALIREVARAQDPATIDQTTAELIGSLRISEEGQEGLRAFLDKRRPAWDRDD